MKLDWKQNILYGTIAATIILVVACIPAGLLLLFDSLTKWKYHWYAWSIIFIGLFIFNVWLIFRRKK